MHNNTCEIFIDFSFLKEIYSLFMMKGSGRFIVSREKV